MGEPRRAWQVRKTRKTAVKGESAAMTGPAQVVYAGTELEAREQGSKMLSSYPGTLEVVEVDSMFPTDEEIEKTRREREYWAEWEEEMAKDPALDYYVK